VPVSWLGARFLAPSAVFENTAASSVKWLAEPGFSFSDTANLEETDVRLNAASGGYFHLNNLTRLLYYPA